MSETTLHIQGKTLGGAAFEYTLNPGDRLCLRGGNGCGKTSLLAALAGLVAHPEQPAVSRHYSGGSWSSALHFIGHRTGICAALSVAEEWQYWHKMLGAKSEQKPCRINDIADKVGLQGAHQRMIHTLSAGQKQKVALARLFITSRPVWLLDEADNHLDQDSRMCLENGMEQHCRQGGIIIDASHFEPRFGAIFFLDKTD